MTCESVLADAAVGLLTGDPLDRAVEEHLDACPECRDEIDGLRPLPALLGTAPTQVEELLSAPPPGDALLERLLAAAAHERSKKAWRTRIVGAAAALVLVIAPAGVWYVAAHRDGAASFSASQFNPATGVTGQVQLKASAWGSALTMAINGVAPETRCTLVVVTHEGTRQTAATWEASYAGTAEVRGTVAADLDSIARVDVVDDSNGAVLLAVPVETG